MATQESNLRDQEEDVTGHRARERREKISLAVDQSSSNGQALLVLPFAAAPGEEVFGRQIGLLLRHRMQALAGLTTGHGQLIATAAGRRRYVPLHHTLPTEQARTCGAGWGAATVLYGAITLQPTLRWTLILRDVASGRALFEDTLVGEAEDLLDAPGDVALALAEALGFVVDDAHQEQMLRREAARLDALLVYLQAMDMRPQHGVEQGNVEGMRKGLLYAIALDPSFGLATDLLTADLVAAPREQAPAEWAAILRDAGAGALAGAALLAHTLEEQGHDEQANLLAGAILEREPQHEAALVIAMRLAYQARDFARARTLVHTLLDVQADHAGAHEVLGNLLAAADRFPGAALHWEVALEQNPNQPKLLMRLGNYLAAAGEFERAYDLLAQAMDLGVTTTESLYKLGVAAYRLGRPGDAIAPLHRALQREPDRPHIHALLARCYQRAGQNDLALVHDGYALQLAPTYWPSALAIGHTALSQGELARALEAYTTVVRMRPDLPEALYGLGIALVANDMYEDAIAALTHARALQPDNVAVICALAMAYMHAGDLAEAQQAVDDATRISPTHGDVLYSTEELQRRLLDELPPIV